MKTFVITACALAGLSIAATAAKSETQSSAELLARLEAKIDALSKENASLRDRVKPIETSRPVAAAPARPALVPPSVAPASASVLSEPVRASQAAAYPVKAVAMPGCPATQFQGGYAGIHGGVTSYTANRTDLDGYLVFIAPVAVTSVGKAWGGMVGGQVGYNWTRCNALFGVELDGSWTSAEASTTLFSNVPDVVTGVSSRLHGLGTARGRAGVVVDNMLLYVTGGVAVGRIETTWTSNILGGIDPPEVLRKSAWRYGWVGGFGAEWAVTDRLSVRSEALYIDLGERDYTLYSPFLSPVTGPFNFKDSDTIWSARVGVNYKFGK
jgi:outer membrane immunogenic protein